MVRISSPFLLEYSAQSYTIAQGELVTFTNRDPGLDHGLVSDSTAGGRPLFEAPVLARGQTHLVRGVPFLGHAGSPYSFRDPAHPTMTATLVVSASGSPLPPDPSPPTAAVKAKRPNKGRGPLRLRLTVSEPVDAVIKVARARASSPGWSAPTSSQAASRCRSRRRRGRDGQAEAAGRVPPARCSTTD